MSEIWSVVDRGAVRPCRRMIPEAYRCACGRVRDRCVRTTVHALWSTPRHTTPPPTQAG